jgi:tetratricopeptide (TPR) repeat protein
MELGMDQDAIDALEVLPEKFKVHPRVLLIRLELLMLKEKWEEGIILGESLCKLWPNEHEFRFGWCYCLHELNRTQEALDTLRSAPGAIRDLSVYSYNCACYECQLGNTAKAKALLKTAFEKDPSLKKQALGDPDLEAIW